MTSPESAPERVFEKHEVLEVMAQYAEGVEVKREKSDSIGLYLLEATIPDSEGGTIEFNYMRKGQYPEGLAQNTYIHKIFYDADGVPCGGTSVASYNETTRQWEDSV
jgi:hypothetical protein